MLRRYVSDAWCEVCKKRCESEPTLSPFAENKTLIELKVIFLERVYLDLYSDKV